MKDNYKGYSKLSESSNDNIDWKSSKNLSKKIYEYFQGRFH